MQPARVMREYATLRGDRRGRRDHQRRRSGDRAKSAATPQPGAVGIPVVGVVAIGIGVEVAEAGTEYAEVVQGVVMQSEAASAEASAAADAVAVETAHGAAEAAASEASHVASAEAAA